MTYILLVSMDLLLTRSMAGKNLQIVLSALKIKHTRVVRPIEINIERLIHAGMKNLLSIPSMIKMTKNKYPDVFRIFLTFSSLAFVLLIQLDNGPNFRFVIFVYD